MTWWTFAGGRINQTLKFALEWKGGWKVIPDNFAIKIQGDDVTPDAVLDVLETLRDPAFWQAGDTRRKLRSLVPEHRLSKFQQVLPDRWLNAHALATEVGVAATTIQSWLSVLEASGIIACCALTSETRASD